MSKALRSGWSRSRTNLALGAVFLGAFVLGTAELVVVGILDLIGEDLAVSISTAGTLVTAYALGIFIGGPVLIALSIRFGRRFLLWLSLAACVAGNVLAVVAVNFGMLLVARIVTGSLHGLFIGVAFAVAAGRPGRPEDIGRAATFLMGSAYVTSVVLDVEGLLA